MRVLSKISAEQRTLAPVKVLGRLPNWRTLYFIRGGLALADFQPALVLLLAAVSGGWAWYGPGHMALVASLLSVVLWATSGNRWLAGAAMACYLCAAGYPVPQAVAVFSQWPMMLSSLVYLAYASLYGLIWAVLWHKHPLGQTLGLAIAFIVFTVPPLGTLYFGSPLIAAGALFPGLGLWGLLATWGLLCTWIWLLAEFGPRPVRGLRLKCIVIGALLGAASLALNAGMKAATISSEGLQVKPLNTHYAQYPDGTRERYQRHFELLDLVDREIRALDDVKQGQTLLLLPEGVAGQHEPRVSWMWDEVAEKARAAGITLALGNSVLQAKNDEARTWVNQLELMGAQSARLRSLVDVPIGSWKPWASSGHYPGRWAQAPDQALIEGHRLGTVLCWEELLIWPWLRHASAGTTDMLIASNTWFDRTGRIDAAQRRSSWALARLWGLDGVVRAANLS